MTPTFNPFTGEFEYHLIVVDGDGQVVDHSVYDYTNDNDYLRTQIDSVGEDLGDLIAQNGWSAESGDCGGIVVCLDHATFGS